MRFAQPVLFKMLRTCVATVFRLIVNAWICLCCCADCDKPQHIDLAHCEAVWESAIVGRAAQHAIDIAAERGHAQAARKLIGFRQKPPAALTLRSRSACNRKRP